MIEVEVRGRLTEEQYEALKKSLHEKGEFLQHLERDMYLLRDYPGYGEATAAGFIGRKTDIRLRNTNGDCELMVKHKVAQGREEISLKFRDNDLETAKRAMKALGFKKAVKMERIMDQYRYNDIDWQIVATPKGLWYWEAEQAAQREDEVQAIHEHLVAEAQVLGLKVMDEKELEEFIHILDTEVNVEVEL